MKLVAPDPNKDLLKFFGSAPAFDFYGLEPKEVPIKIFEFEMEQKLKLLSQAEASVDVAGVVGELLHIDMKELYEVLHVNGLALVSLSAKPAKDTLLVWLQWLLANRGVDVSLDEMKVRVGYDAINEFVERLTPKKKAGGEGKSGG